MKKLVLSSFFCLLISFVFGAFSVINNAMQYGEGDFHPTIAQDTAASGETHNFHVWVDANITHQDSGWAYSHVSISGAEYRYYSADTHNANPISDNFYPSLYGHYSISVDCYAIITDGEFEIAGAHATVEW